MMEESIKEQFTNEEKFGSSRFFTICLWVLGVLLVACGIAVRTTIMTSAVRALLVATFSFGIFTLLAYLVRMFSSHHRAVYPALFFSILFFVWAALGDKPYDAKMLQSVYMKRLGQLEGTPYVWGGETDEGIDCSGLARVALWRAMLTQGIREVNPRLLGPMLWEFWWRDISAKDMLDCKYGYTRVVGRAPKLAGYDTSKLRRGDMAIAGDGAHVMVLYLDGKWIDASLDNKNVAAEKADQGNERRWFNAPVVFVRWWVFENLPKDDPTVYGPGPD